MGPGEYNQNLVRTTWADSVVVPGYTTLRLRSSSTINENSGFEGNVTQVVLENKSTDYTATVQFMETDNVVSGPRYNASAVLTVAPLGTATTTIYPRNNYLELAALPGANNGGDLQIQLSSKLKFDQMAFDRSDPLYPQVLWAAAPSAGEYPEF